MKVVLFTLTLFFVTLTGFGQTVENIRVEQDGENLKITYRIGASTETQLFNVVLTCSMDGATRFEPQAVIGDVGRNVIGGKSYYTIIWDVFEDVDEVINPEFFVRIEKVSDSSPAVVIADPVTRSQEQDAADQQQEEQMARQEDDKPAQQPANEPDFEEKMSGPDFSRNGFFAYNGSFWYPIGVSFGSLNNWGYYVTPVRIGISSLYTILGSDNYYYDVIDFDYMIAAGVTKYIVSGGIYRLHGYAGLGLHNDFDALGYEGFYQQTHAMFDAGVVNVIGGLNLTLGFSVSFGYAYPAALIFGIGFVF